MKYFPLHNRFFFWSVVALLVTILTTINNHYFYQFKDYQVSSQHKRLIATLDASYSQCRIQFADGGNCEKMAVRTVEKANWLGEVRIADASGNVLLEYDNQKYQRERKSVTTRHLVGNGSDALTVTISELSSPMLMTSVYRSLTFSIADIVSIARASEEGQRLGFYVTNIAWHRSRPFVFFLLSSLFVLWLARKNAEQLMARVSSREAQIDLQNQEIFRHLSDAEKSQSELEELRFRKEKQELEVKQLQDLLEEQELLKEQELAAKDAHGANQDQAKLGHREEEISRLRSKLESASGRNREFATRIRLVEGSVEEKDQKIRDLDASKEKLEQELYRLEGQAGYESKRFKEHLLRALLRNPNIPAQKFGKANVGKHHSKDFVGKLTRQISENSYIGPLVRSVTSAEYQPNRRGKVLVLWNDRKNAYSLQVIDKGDAGFAAEVILNAKAHWQAIIEAKCMVETVSMLKGYPVEDRVVA